jgi:hypothetical protein
LCASIRRKSAHGRFVTTFFDFFAEPFADRQNSLPRTGGQQARLAENPDHLPLIGLKT